MPTIINIRGGNGSGKSTAVVGLIKYMKGEPMLNEAGKIWAYNLQNRIFVLGRYETPTGGCDGIKTQEEVCTGIRKLAALGSVVFEGAQISTMYTRYRNLEEELKSTHKWIWTVMDTPLDKCIENIRKRREAKGNTKPFDPQKTVVGKFRSATVTTREALEQQGCDVRSLCHDFTLASLLDWLGERPLIYRMVERAGPVQGHPEDIFTYICHDQGDKDGNI